MLCNVCESSCRTVPFCLYCRQCRALHQFIEQLPSSNVSKFAVWFHFPARRDPTSLTASSATVIGLGNTRFMDWKRRSYTRARSLYRFEFSWLFRRYVNDKVKKIPCPIFTQLKRRIIFDIQVIQLERKKYVITPKTGLRLSSGIMVVSFIHCSAWHTLGLNLVLNLER